MVGIYIALLSLGVIMLVTGLVLVIRFGRRHRVLRPRARTVPQRPRGPAGQHQALLGALLIAFGLLLTVFAAVLTFAPRHAVP
jgi:hypothetical protein